MLGPQDQAPLQRCCRVINLLPRRETSEQGTLIWKHPCVNIPAVSVVFALWDHQLQPCTAFCTHGHFPLSSFWSPTPSFPCRAFTCTPIQKCTPQTTLDLVCLPKWSFKDVGSQEAWDGGHGHNDVEELEEKWLHPSLPSYQQPPGPGAKLMSLSRPGAAKAV